MGTHALRSISHQLLLFFHDKDVIALSTTSTSSKCLLRGYKLKSAYRIHPRAQRLTGHLIDVGESELALPIPSSIVSADLSLERINGVGVGGRRGHAIGVEE